MFLGYLSNPVSLVVLETIGSPVFWNYCPRTEKCTSCKVFHEKYLYFWRPRSRLGEKKSMVLFSEQVIRQLRIVSNVFPEISCISSKQILTCRNNFRRSSQKLGYLCGKSACCIKKSSQKPWSKVPIQWKENKVASLLSILMRFYCNNFNYCLLGLQNYCFLGHANLCESYSKNQDRLEQLFWYKSDSNYLDISLKVFKKDDSKELRLEQSLTMGEEDFSQFMW